MNKAKLALSCFKAYDIRGKLGSQLNEDIAYRIGRAYGQYCRPEKVALGGDARLTSESLKASLANGLMDAGVDVVDLGMTGTEEIYYAAFAMDVDGGIEVTASHNPIDYNGMKPVGKGAAPIGKTSGLNEIQAIAESGEFEPVEVKGSLFNTDNRPAYIEHILSYIAPANIKPLKLVVNAGNGAAGPVVDEIEKRFNALNVPVEFIKVHHQPDGTFPNGIPNPLLPENRASTSEAVLKHKADFGIAWDGDFDRCFLFDENGRFIEGYYIVGLLAQAFLQQDANQKIIFDPRAYWNTEQVIKELGGTPVMSKSGHAIIKEKMREVDAVYGGEMSAHHYFRDFAYCDSGMIPWLLIAELISVKGIKLSSMVDEMIAAYPASSEINFKLEEPKRALQRVQDYYAPKADSIEDIDGIGMAFKGSGSAWRFNLRSSNTEPVVRLNIESEGNRNLIEEKIREISSLLNA
ncbi:phosphomannomutase CpsG [Vibrio sp. JC009]|uniref:phosphomannomutase CpsG n=1 Tax=Vibrio sp. JC009 TaxID=2912314 RepID=UPI0023B02C16|nr:phosphomannomutase CpsG [Vibrio sp. JC009]WED20625.1 phosphomannomutase CpsG [Vibrio sp. JC009]